jgi:hypothetical protein
VLHGDVRAGLVLAIWLAAAGFGLYAAARRLHGLITVGRTPPRPMRHHRWRDGVAPSAPGAGDAERLLPEDRDAQPGERPG